MRVHKRPNDQCQTQTQASRLGHFESTENLRLKGPFHLGSYTEAPRVECRSRGTKAAKRQQKDFASKGSNKKRQTKQQKDSKKTATIQQQGLPLSSVGTKAAKIIRVDGAGVDPVYVRYVCMFICVYIYVYIYIYIHTHVCMHMYVCMYVYIYIYIYTHTYVCV